MEAKRLQDARVCIVGLGLMGGSLALALRGRAAKLVGVELHAATRRRALRGRVVDVVTADLAEGARQADLLVLATPVSVILTTLAALPRLRPAGCAVLDLGSTKTDISARMERLPAGFEAIGGHPMCGKEQAGLAAADEMLYCGQTFVLCRNGRTTPRVEQLALELVTAVGAQPLFLPPETHDEIAATVSHVPYLAASALVHSAAAMADERVWPVSASGFRDAARLAGSDPRMMLDILKTNRAAVLARLAHYQQALTAVAELLRADDEQLLSAWLSETQRHYADYRQHKEGFKEGFYVHADDGFRRQHAPE